MGKTAESTERLPKVGDAVWFIGHDSGRDPIRDLRPRPATLYENLPGGGQSLNVQQQGGFFFVWHSAYCGSDWKNGGWCWPGEDRATIDEG